MLKKQATKRLSFCAIILAAISGAAQVKPYSPPAPKSYKASAAAIDTTHFDSIINTHQALQKLLRDEMQMQDP
jgi:hypothetical protein